VGRRNRRVHPIELGQVADTREELLDRARLAGVALSQFGIRPIVIRAEASSHCTETCSVPV